MGECEVKLGSLGTTATNRPIVPAVGDYDDGEIGGMIGTGNRSTRRKPIPVPRYFLNQILIFEDCSWLRHCGTSPKVVGSVPDVSSVS
jgi:hypothetical protein